MPNRTEINTAWGALMDAGQSLLKAEENLEADPSLETDGSDSAVNQVESTQGVSVSLPPAPPDNDPRSLLFDPFALIDQLGYRDRPSGLTYNTLRDMSKRVPTVTGIVQTRITQAANYAQRQLDLREPGFAVGMRDTKAHPTHQEKIRMRQLEDWLLGTGSRWTPGRDDFKAFLRKIVRDSLDLDQCCFEIVRNRRDEPAEFYALDAATIRIADAPPSVSASRDVNQVSYVQVYDEIIIAEYAAHELCFGVRNPRSDIRANGYGFSELEMLINTVTATLWAFEFNKRAFSQGSQVNGVMNFKGGVSDKKVDAFRRQWKQMIAGVNNSHRVPMTNVDELQWIDFGKNNRDMEYNAWMDWLIKVTCAVYQFDPAEINFVYGNAGQSSAMFQAPAEAKLQSSKDRGLRPLLKDIANWINMYLIWPLDPHMEFAFRGMDTKTSKDAIEQQKLEGEFKKTVDELRAEDDLDPLPDGKGQVILNTVWLQNAQALQQAPPAQPGADVPPGQEQGTNEAPPVSAEEDVTNLMDDQPGEGPDDQDSDSQFADAFPDSAEKALRRPDELRKGGPRKARVRVYDIEL